MDLAGRSRPERKVARLTERKVPSENTAKLSSKQQQTEQHQMISKQRIKPDKRNKKNEKYKTT